MKHFNLARWREVQKDKARRLTQGRDQHAEKEALRKELGDLVAQYETQVERGLIQKGKP